MQTPHSKFLFFSPYADWSYHTLLEATWAHGLRALGAEARFVLCDQVLPACDIYRPKVNPRHEFSCLDCMGRTAKQFQSMRTQFEWLGSWLPRSVRSEASEWVAGLQPNELQQAVWQGRPVGQWASTSVYYHLRASSIDLQNFTQVQLMRDHLQGVVRAMAALEALFEEVQPDTLVLLNGRFFTHWAAIELAKERGIRVVTHERGLNRNTVRFAENHRTHELAPMRELWETWRDVPLDEAGLNQVLEVLRDRCMGINYSVNPFSPPLGAEGQPESLREHLGLDSRPLVAVFTSSNDETAAFTDRCAGAFPNAADFVPATLELAKQLPHIQFVIRIHPNVQSKLGTNEEQLAEALEARRTAPENLRVVLPDEVISSYALVDEADVGVVYASTLGLEMACTGMQVLCMAQSTYHHVGCTRNVQRPEDYAGQLLEALEQGNCIDVARRALRWARIYFETFALPFSLVQEQSDFRASLNYTSLDGLRPGCSPELDLVTGKLLGEIPIIPQPTRAQQQGPAQVENHFLGDWVQLPAGLPPVR